MKTAIKIILIASAALVVVGLGLVGVAFAAGVSTTPAVTQDKVLENNQEFTSIKITTFSADISVEESTNGKTHVICEESKNITYSMNIENGVLTLTEEDDREWYEHMQISFDDRELTLYLADGNYEGITIETASGDIECDEELTFVNAYLTSESGSIDFSSRLTGELSVTTASGDIEADNIKPASLNIASSSGEVELENVIASEKISVKTASGQISLEGCDASELSIESASGSVHALLLSDKLFEVESDSGKTDIPPSIKDGGKCTVKTASGNIKIKIAN